MTDAKPGKEIKQGKSKVCIKKVIYIKCTAIQRQIEVILDLVFIELSCCMYIISIYFGTSLEDG